MRIDPEKVTAIRDLQAPTTVKGVRSFLGFTNVYRRFIRHFGKITQPLVNPTRKGVTFGWRENENNSFEHLKETF